MPTIPDVLASVILEIPLPCTLMLAGSTLCVAAGVQAWKWQTLARYARFVGEQPVQKLADATAELGRQNAAGRRGSIVGVFEGYIACNCTPPLKEGESLRSSPHVFHARQIHVLRRSSSLVAESVSEVPFEICDRSLGSCVHVFSRPVLSVPFRTRGPAASVQEFLPRYPPLPRLRVTENSLRVGDWVTAVGELSLEPWMSSTDLRPVLRAPDSPHLPDFVILNPDGKRAISEALKAAGERRLRRAYFLLALAAAFFAGAWVVWQRRRSRTLRNMAIIGDIQQYARRFQEHRHERYAPSASPILRPCSVCQVRARDCVLLDCNHQVCCLECAQRLLPAAAAPVSPSPAARAEAGSVEPGAQRSNHSPATQGAGWEAGMPGIPACPLCAAPVRQVLRVYTS